MPQRGTLRTVLPPDIGGPAERQSVRGLDLRRDVAEQPPMRIVPRQFRTCEGVEAEGSAVAPPGDLCPDRLRAIVVADRLPAVEEVDLRGPMRVEGVRCLQSGLVVRRELSHPAARVVPVVLREEALVTDVRRVNPRLQEQPGSDRRHPAHARLVHGPPDFVAGRRSGGLRGMNDVRAAPECKREVKADRMRIERDVQRRRVDVDFVRAARSRSRSRNEARAIQRPTRR